MRSIILVWHWTSGLQPRCAASVALSGGATRTLARSSLAASRCTGGASRAMQRYAWRHCRGTMVGGRQIDGLLGRDFLSLFDLDLDFPRQTLTLYDVHGCTGRFLPWTEPYLSVAVDNPTESAAGGSAGYRRRAVAGAVGLRRQPEPGRGAAAWPVLVWALTNCRRTRARSSVAWVRTLSQCGNTNFANFRSAARASPIRCFSSHQFNYNQSATCCWARTGCSAAGSGFPMRPNQLFATK